MVGISRKEHITYSDRTQEYPDFFPDHQPGKRERSILTTKQRTLEQFEHIERNHKVFQPESPLKIQQFLKHGKQRQE